MRARMKGLGGDEVWKETWTVHVLACAATLQFARGICFSAPSIPVHTSQISDGALRIWDSRPAAETASSFLSKAHAVHESQDRTGRMCGFRKPDSCALVRSSRTARQATRKMPRSFDEYLCGAICNFSPLGSHLFHYI